MAESLEPTLHVQAAPWCPVCGGKGPLRFNGLRDRLYGSPGTWRMRRCATCESLWLDPRPSGESLVAAYADYYTHDSEEHSGRGNPQRRLASWAGDKYRRAQRSLARRRWGYPIDDLIGSVLAAALAGWSRTRLDADLWAGHLPADRLGRALDVGCGAGDLMVSLEDLGWRTTGIDPDAAAVATARARGLDVIAGTVDQGILGPQRFEAVLAVHVIEHVEDPHRFVRQLGSLLTADGTLVIVTPNAESRLLARYGSNWRGLEPPRHLTVFSPRALMELIEAHNFAIERCETVCRGANVNWRASDDLTLKHGHDKRRPPTITKRIQAEIALLTCDWNLRRSPCGGEEIVLVARPTD